MPRLTMAETIPGGSDPSNIVDAMPTSSNNDIASVDADALPDADPPASVANISTGLSSPQPCAQLHSVRNLADVSATAYDVVAVIPTTCQSSRTLQVPVKFSEETNQVTAKSKKSNSKKETICRNTTKIQAD